MQREKAQRKKRVTRKNRERERKTSVKAKASWQITPFKYSFRLKRITTE